ncbi:MAG: hypothetical protein ACOCQM_00555 [Natronomonas sp.]
MSPRSVPTPVGRSEVSHSILWALAVLFFGVGDVVTTSVGLGVEGLFESGPVTSVLVERYGLGGMVASKTLIFGGCFLCWRVVQRPYRVGVPLGLALLGVSVTGWNLYLLALVVPA